MHYITGKTFSGWVRESGLQAGEQVRMKKDGARVLIQRVPSDRKASRPWGGAACCWQCGAGAEGWFGGINNLELQLLPLCQLASAQMLPGCFPALPFPAFLPLQVRVDFTTKTASRSVSLAGMSDAAMAGAPASHGQELASPPAAEALEALDALVAAAGYAGTHGTPAIQAALAGAAGAAAAAAIAAAGLHTAAGLHAVDMLMQQGIDLSLGHPPPLIKRRRTGEAEPGSAAELLQERQEQQVLLARRASGGGGGMLQGMPQAPFSLAGWQPSAPHVVMFRAINQILAGHEWSPAELSDLLRFRWVLLPSVGCMPAARGQPAWVWLTGQG